MSNVQKFQADLAQILFQKWRAIAVTIGLVVVLIGCTNSNKPSSTTVEATDEVQTSEAAETAAETSAGNAGTDAGSDTNAAQPEAPAEEVAAVPTDTPIPEPTAEPLFYNLPDTKMLYASVLYASPNRDDPIIPVPVPEGENVFIMGRNATQTHLRVVWNTGVGWIPVSFTDYNGQQARLSALPIFEREPPACAVPVTTQFGLNSTWTSDLDQKVAVVVDLFRSQYGNFPLSSLALVVNNFYVEDSRREIVEQGQFSLKDVVLSLPQNVQPGDVVGYQLDTDSDEPLTFMATIFTVPFSCQWDID